MKIYYFCFKNFGMGGYTNNRRKIIEFIEKYNILEDEVVIKETYMHLALLDFFKISRTGRKRIKRLNKIEKLQNKRCEITNRIEFLEKYERGWERV